MTDIEELKKLINPKKNADKQFYLDLLDGEKQARWEDIHVAAVLKMLKIAYLSKLSRKIKQAEEEKNALMSSEEYNAEKYRRVLVLNAEIADCRKKQQSYKCFFDEPYFARMDLIDDKDGYNSYYIGKRGDEWLEIVDWRAPLARRYYQKSTLNFTIGEFDYRLVLRRAIRTRSGKVVEFRNEYLSVGDALTKEEIGGRDASVIFDPFLKEILQSRKEKQEICDIIETIQEKQYEIITAPERAEFVVQGVAGSGKTMILLHRLSYLMYNNEDIKPSGVLVITPSDSFNAFIDELSRILELERIKTITLENYFIKLLQSIGLDISGKINYFAPVPEEYRQYLYSADFVADVRKKLNKIFCAVRGMIPDGDDVIVSNVLACTEKQIKIYEKIKNAGLRVRRCVLGEIKEKPDGGLFYTKQMRNLFNCVYQVAEFLTLNRGDERMKRSDFFYVQLFAFYRSLRYISQNASKICAAAVDDLHSLYGLIEREITDLKRYKQYVGNRAEYTYPDRIAKREATQKEITATVSEVEEISYCFNAAIDFAEVVRGEKHVEKIGGCADVASLAKYFYREIIKPVKIKYGMDGKLKSGDAYALCLLLTEMGFTLTPTYSFVFVDEAQDISPSEYEMLKKINSSACFNVFGDLSQNITPYRGVKSWGTLPYNVYNLELNYRNTNQIVNYVSDNLGVKMQSIGLNGGEVVEISGKGIASYLSGKAGLRAVITSEKNLAAYTLKSYNVVRESGKISKSKINIMTVYESKGLEFTAVAVVDGDMTVNEKYVAYTRALKELAVVRK